MRVTRFYSRFLPDSLHVYLVEGWPADAVQVIGQALLIAEASCRGASLIRARRTLREIGKS